MSVETYLDFIAKPAGMTGPKAFEVYESLLNAGLSPVQIEVLATAAQTHVLSTTDEEGIVGISDRVTDEPAGLADLLNGLYGWQADASPLLTVLEKVIVLSRTYELQD